MNWSAIAGNGPLAGTESGSKRERIHLSTLQGNSSGISIDLLDLSPGPDPDPDPDPDQSDYVDSSSETRRFFVNNNKRQSVAFYQDKPENPIFRNYFPPCRYRTLRIVLAASFILNLVLLVSFIVSYSRVRSSQGALEQKVGHIEDAVEKIEKDIHEMQRGKGLSCDFWENVQLLPLINLDCGGLIALPLHTNQSAHSILIEHKSNHTYNQVERCLWTLDNRQRRSGRSYRLKVRITMLCNGFENSRDVLSLIEWDVKNGLSSHSLLNETHDYITDDFVDGLFLSLSASWGPRTGPSLTGFILRLDVLTVAMTTSTSTSTSESEGPGGLILGHIFDHTTYPGSSSYGPYGRFDRFSLVVNPEESKTLALTVDYTDFLYQSQQSDSHCLFYDSLEILEIREGGIPNVLDRLCGNVTSELSYTTDYPVLVLFYTINSTVGNGFGLSWRSH